MSKNYGSSEATVNIAKPGGEKLAIFDVSPTTECRWIAISNKEHRLLEVFGSHREMLEFVALAQIGGAYITEEGNFLNEQAGHEGFDSWAEYVNDQRAEMEPPEFPVYYDAQGREHAEF